MSDQQIAAGAWTPWHFELSADAHKVFHEVTGHLIGVKYSALAFATQVVAGLNYSFLAKARVVHPGAPERVVVIRAYVPAGGGEAHVTSINDIQP